MNRRCYFHLCIQLTTKLKYSQYVNLDEKLNISLLDNEISPRAKIYDIFLVNCLFEICQGKNVFLCYDAIKRTDQLWVYIAKS